MSRHYIVVVHGMGEQKLNATAYEVVHRFAEIRQDQKHQGNAHYANFLAAHLSTQSVRLEGEGHHWSEFNGIEVNPAVPTGNFDGLPVSNSNWAGKNFRFVDLHWAQILQGQTEKGFASSTEAWTGALLNRLDPQTGITPKEWLESWTLPVLHLIRETVIPIKKFLDFKYPELSQVVFEDVLGDIHLYGDYGQTRGRAVRHFHGVLDEIHLGDFIDWCKYGPHRGEMEYEPPSYTVIAHSLGSIMGFDALVYAFTDFRIRRASTNDGGYSPSFPFYGYTEGQPEEVQKWLGLLSELHTAWENLDESFRNQNAEETYDRYCNFIDYLHVTSPSKVVPPLFWRDQVKHFFTFGSPIDKFHVLWYQNYLHMGLRKTIQNSSTPLFPIVPWMNDWINPAPGQKILHINLCDEQDPVGHHLGVAESSINYNEIFDATQPVLFRDILFRRYGIPGLAHIDYWKDKKLFSGVLEIIDAGVCGINFPKDFRQPSHWPYFKAILWAYFILPVTLVFITDVIILYPYLGEKGDTFGYTHGLALVVAGVLWVQPKVLDILVGGSISQHFSSPWRWAVVSWLILNILTLGIPFILTKCFKRGLFANLVYGAVVWRRILIQKYEDGCPDWNTAIIQDKRLSLPTWGRFYFYFIPTYGLTICLLALSFALAFPSQFQELKGIITTTSTIKTILSFDVLPSPLQAEELLEPPKPPASTPKEMAIATPMDKTVATSESKEESKANPSTSVKQIVGELGLLFLVPYFFVMSYVWGVYSQAKYKVQKVHQDRNKGLAKLKERPMAPENKELKTASSARENKLLNEPITEAERKLFFRE